MSKLFRLQRKWRGQEKFTTSAFLHALTKTKGTLPKRQCTHLSCLEANVFFSSSSKKGAGLDSKERLKREVQKNFSHFLTVPLLVIVFISGLRKYWWLHDFYKYKHFLKSGYFGSICWRDKRELISSFECSASLGFYLICIFKKWES